MKYFSRYLKPALLVLLLTSAFVFHACKEDDPVPVTTVSFANSSQVIGEQSGEQSINLTFDRPAAVTGTFIVTFTSADGNYGEDFTTSPAGTSGSFEITIAKGQSAAQFKITPVNNNLLDGNKTVEFSLSEPEKGFEIGSTNEIAISITDDEAPAQANFAVGSSSIVESASAGTDINVNFSVPVPGNGNLTINLTSANATYGTHYTTVPAAVNNAINLPVTPGQNNVAIKIIPIDNFEVGQAKEVSFNLSSFSTNAATIGSLIAKHIVTINDDETPSTVTFASASGTLSEDDATGITVNLAIEPAATAAGSVKISIASENAVYSTNFTTDPAAVEGLITVPVTQGQPTVSFKVLSVNDTETNAARIIDFNISGGTGIITVPSSGIKYTLTINDDDVATSIAVVRALYQGAAATITDDIYIRGIITSTNDNLNSRNAFIQDASGAIQLRFSANNTLIRGDEVKVLLKDVALGLNSGLLQLGGSAGMPNSNATKVADGTVPAYQTITLSDLNAGTYEGKLVKLDNVGFFDANGLNNLRYDGGLGAGNNKIGDASGNSAIMRVESTSTSPNSPFAASVIPAGTGTLRGIAIVFNNVWQISPMIAADIFAGTESAVITASQTVLSFGDVNNNSSGTQTYQVSGSMLLSGVIIKAPASYTLSTDGNTFASEVTIPSGTANAGPVTVTVKFEPKSGVNQTIAGKISHKSLGAIVKEVDVTGNEIGNGAGSSLLLNEQFNYDAGQLTAVNSGANVSGGKWVNFSGTSLPLNVTAGSLSYSNYPGATGNKVSMVNGSAEDAYTPFTSANTGKVYVAFLVSVTSATGLLANSNASGDYFAGYLPGNSTSNFAGRILIKAGAASNTLNFGFRATGISSNPAEFIAADLALNTTHLIVMSYEFVSGTTNDVVKFWVNPVISATEPAANITQTSAGDSPDISRFYLRQGTNAVNADIDGIRVALKWEDLFPSN